MHRGKKNILLVLVTWKRWPPRPYTVKLFKNLFLQNHKSDYLETWHIAKQKYVPKNSYINDDPELTLTYFTTKSTLIIKSFTPENFVHTFKFHLRNHWTDLNQNLYGTSMPRENESLYKWSWSYDQDGRLSHVLLKPFKNVLLQNHKSYYHGIWNTAKGT